MLRVKRQKIVVIFTALFVCALPEIGMSKRSDKQWDIYYRDALEHRLKVQSIRDSQKGFLQMSLKELFKDKQARELAKAASKCKLKQMQKMLDQGVDINTEGTNGATPLLPAFNCYKAFKFLLERGANPNASYGSIMTIAASMDTPEYLLELLKNGGDPNIVNLFPQTPLITAIVRKRWENVDVLLENGVDINQWTPLGESAGMTAARAGHFDLIYRFLQMGLKYEERNKYGDSILEALGYGEQNMRCSGKIDPYFIKVESWLAERGAKIIYDWPRPSDEICPNYIDD